MVVLGFGVSVLRFTCVVAFPVVLAYVFYGLVDLWNFRGLVGLPKFGLGCLGVGLRILLMWVGGLLYLCACDISSGVCVGFQDVNYLGWFMVNVVCN